MSQRLHRESEGSDVASELPYPKDRELPAPPSPLPQVKNVPALVCDCCDDAYIAPDVSERIDKVLEDFFVGKLLAEPIEAGEVALSLNA